MAQAHPKTVVQFSLTKSLTLSFACTEDCNEHALQTTCKVASRADMRYQHEAALACARWNCRFIKLGYDLRKWALIVFPMPYGAKKYA